MLVVNSTIEAAKDVSPGSGGLDTSIAKVSNSDIVARLFGGGKSSECPFCAQIQKCRWAAGAQSLYETNAPLIDLFTLPVWTPDTAGGDPFLLQYLHCT